MANAHHGVSWWCHACPRASRCIPAAPHPPPAVAIALLFVVTLGCGGLAQKSFKPLENFSPQPRRPPRAPGAGVPPQDVCGCQRNLLRKRTLPSPGGWQRSLPNFHSTAAKIFFSCASIIRSQSWQDTAMATTTGVWQQWDEPRLLCTRSTGTAWAGMPHPGSMAPRALPRGPGRR